MKIVKAKLNNGKVQSAVTGTAEELASSIVKAAKAGRKTAITFWTNDDPRVTRNPHWRVTDSQASPLGHQMVQMDRSLYEQVSRKLSEKGIKRVAAKRALSYDSHQYAQAPAAGNAARMARAVAEDHQRLDALGQRRFAKAVTGRKMTTGSARLKSRTKIPRNNSAIVRKGWAKRKRTK